jgi:hypothetical protein
VQGIVIRESKKDIFFCTLDGVKMRLFKDSFETLPPGYLMDAEIIIKPTHKKDKLMFGVMKD